MPSYSALVVMQGCRTRFPGMNSFPQLMGLPLQSGCVGNLWQARPKSDNCATRLGELEQLIRLQFAMDNPDRLGATISGPSKSPA